MTDRTSIENAVGTPLIGRTVKMNIWFPLHRQEEPHKSVYGVLSSIEEERIGNGSDDMHYRFTFKGGAVVLLSTPSYKWTFEVVS